MMVKVERTADSDFLSLRLPDGGAIDFVSYDMWKAYDGPDIPEGGSVLYGYVPVPDTAAATLFPALEAL